jgi:hypothetical protein
MPINNIWRAATHNRRPRWVKMRNSQSEHKFFGLALIADTRRATTSGLELIIGREPNAAVAAAVEYKESLYRRDAHQLYAHTSSTAFRNVSSDTSQYSAVVPMCRWPMSFWIVRIPTPLALRRVAKVLRPDRLAAAKTTACAAPWRRQRFILVMTVGGSMRSAGRRCGRRSTSALLRVFGLNNPHVLCDREPFHLFQALPLQRTNLLPRASVDWQKCRWSE